MNTGISVAWLSERNSYADSVQNRVWRAIRADSTWQQWLSAHEEPDLEIFVEYEDRPKERLEMRRSTITYKIPATHVQAAHEARTLPAFMADVFRDVYVKYAQKRGLPEPPAVDSVAPASRLP